MLFRLKVIDNGTTSYTSWAAETVPGVASAMEQIRFAYPDSSISIERKTGPPIAPPLVRPANASVADQTLNADSSAVLTGSTISIPVGKLRVGTILRWRISLSKTAAGTDINSFAVRLGATGTISDAAILTFNLPGGTATIDAGQIELLLTIRGPLGASCITQGQLTLIHNLPSAGLATVPCVVLNVTSDGFNSTMANLIASVSCNTAPSTVLTFHQVQSGAINV